jgi:hypothetical protein
VKGGRFLYYCEGRAMLRKSVQFPFQQQQTKQTLRPESASELCRPSDRLLSAKLVPTFADRGCHMVSVTDPYCRNLSFLTGAATFSV